MRQVLLLVFCSARCHVCLRSIAKIWCSGALGTSIVLVLFCFLPKCVAKVKFWKLGSCSPSVVSAFATFATARSAMEKLDIISTRDPTQRNRGKHRRSSQNSRMATASNNPRSHGQLQWTPRRHPSSQPGPATIPSWPLRQPCLHRHTLFHRVWISFPPFSLRRLRLHLPLSARSCRCRRPLDPLGDHRAACAQSGVLRSRGAPRKGSSTHPQRRRGESHHQYPTRWPQHPEPVQGRRPPHRGHRQRATNVGGAAN